MLTIDKITIGEDPFLQWVLSPPALYGGSLIFKCPHRSSVRILLLVLK